MNPEQSIAEASQLLEEFGKNMVPMIGFCSPQVLNMDERNCTIVLPLNTQTKNHLGSMYFGALHVGADCAAGLLAMREIYRLGAKVSLVFKDSNAQFFKRPDGDVHFSCNGGLASAQLVNLALKTGEREECVLQVLATVPSKNTDAIVAEFNLTLSLKRHD